MDYDGFLELVRKRRSIRLFKPDPVPDDYIDKIIEAARWAPSGANVQPWEFVVVRNPEYKDKIVELVRESRATYPRVEATREAWMPPTHWGPQHTSGNFATAPVFILVLWDSRVRIGQVMVVRHTNEKWRSSHISSLSNAVVYMHLAATTLGLGSQWVSQISEASVACLVKDMLGIPMEYDIYDMVALGYPDMVPGPRLVRDRKEIAHYDYCGPETFRTDQEVRDFITEMRKMRAKDR